MLYSVLIGRQKQYKKTLRSKLKKRNRMYQKTVSMLIVQTRQRRRKVATIKVWYNLSVCFIRGCTPVLEVIKLLVAMQDVWSSSWDDQNNSNKTESAIVFTCSWMNFMIEWVFRFLCFHFDTEQCFMSPPVFMHSGLVCLKLIHNIEHIRAHPRKILATLSQNYF